MLPILSELIFLPLLGAVLILGVPACHKRLIQIIALTVTGASLILAVLLAAHFNVHDPKMQFVEQLPWIIQIGAQYFLGVDGLSIAMVFLTALLGFLACLGSLGIDKRIKEYFIFYLLLMTGMMGTFLSLDMLLFYVFWELVLVPMYFLIGIWGGPRREYAAIKFFLYTLAGSVVMLVGLLTVYFNVHPHTFNMLTLVDAASGFDIRMQMFLFAAFYLAFAVKVPVFPFHTWLPDAHVEAPTPISVLLAGVLLKMGAYGFLRICFPIFKDGSLLFAALLAFLGAFNVIYGACVAFSQKDFKKMIAYSSVSHMGFVMLGFASFTTAGINGAILEMFNHGIITGALFFLVGMVYDRAHTRDLDQFGGLSAQMPRYAFFLTICSLASLGLPGLSGFVGEFLSLLGAFGRYPGFVVVAGVGLLVTAGYFLIMIKHVLFGKAQERVLKFPDMNARELCTVIPLTLITIVVGLNPMWVLQFQQTAVSHLLKLFP